MSQSERWHLGGRAPEVYEAELGRLCSWQKRHSVRASECSTSRVGQGCSHAWPLHRSAMQATWLALTSIPGCLPAHAPRRCASPES